MSKLISHKEFWALLRENAGIYSKTAKAIEKRYNLTYSRQAVKNRAERKPELLKDILDENLDVVEDNFLQLLNSSNEKTKLNASEFYLKTKGKDRGYVDRIEIDQTGKDLFLEAMKAASKLRREMEKKSSYNTENHGN